MADYGWICPECGQDCLAEDQTSPRASSGPGVVPSLVLSPSANVPACRDEDPAWSASLAACYPDPPEYAHPEDDDGGAFDMAPGYGGWGG